jgi:hypothetical protein
LRLALHIVKAVPFDREEAISRSQKLNSSVFRSVFSKYWSIDFPQLLRAISFTFCVLVYKEFWAIR